jgi:DNA polymerase III delta subunit
MSKNIWIFTGTERFLQQRAIDALVKQQFPQHQVFYASPERGSAKELLPLISERPLLSKGTVLVVEEAHKLKSSEVLVKSLSASNALILLAEKPMKGITGETRDFSPLKEKALIHFLQQEAKQQGFELTPEAAHLLVAQKLADVGTLIQELQKFYLIADTAVITPELVTQYAAGIAAAPDIFAITRAFRDRRFLEALAVFRELKHEQSRVVYFLWEEFKRLLILKTAPNFYKGVALCKLPRFLTGEYQKALTHFTQKQLEQALVTIQNYHDRMLANRQGLVEGGYYEEPDLILQLVVVLAAQLGGPA